MSTRASGAAVVLMTATLAVVMLAFMASTAQGAEQRNPDCLLCHEVTQQFGANAVDKDSACRACHTPGLLGTHPYHQPGANCGAYCHPGWGESLLTAVPAYLTSAGSFASPVSQDTDPGIIHLIHSKPRWPAGIDTSVSACASCHSAAACDACHTDGLSPVHETHGSTENSPYTRTVGYGIIGEDQMIKSTAEDSSLCGTAECHGVAALESGTPLTKEDFSHPAYPEYGYPEANTVSLTGTWRVRRGTSFTGGQMSYSNVANSTLEVAFTGNKVTLVSDLDPYRGRAEVWIDGSYVDTIDTYSATTKYQRVVWRSATLTDGPHTIMVKVLGTKQAGSRAAYVNVDAFKVYASLRDLIAPECDASCHSDKTEGHGGSFTHEATQTAGTYPAGRFACTDCHSLSMWTEHDRTSSSSQPDGCGACHTVYADFVLDEYVNAARTGYGSCTWVGDGSTTGCHQVANSEDPHNFIDTDHDASGIGATSDCRGCHGDDLSVIHDDTNASRPQHSSLVGNGWATDCLTCHGPAVFPTTKDCTDAGCHVGSGVVSMGTHPAPAHNGTNNNAGVPRTGGKSCSTCHILELTSEHGKATSVTDPGAAAIGCTDCHNAIYFPAGWLDTPGTTNTCNACHDPAGATDAGLPHEVVDYTLKHDWNPPVANAAACGGSYCHDGDSAWLDDINAVDLLHEASKPGAGDCTSCHDTNTAVPSETLCSDCHGTHTATSTIHNASSGSYPANSDCLVCHASYASAYLVHSGGCIGCHENSTLTASATQYLGGNYDMTCTGCHNSTDLGTYDYQPYDPNHYDEYAIEHTVPNDGRTLATGGSVITEMSCWNCHARTMKVEHLFTLSSGNVDCFDCHTSTAPIDAVTVINNDWPGNTCDDCHGPNHGGIGLSAHDMSASATSLGCSAGGCHSGTDDVGVLHADADDGSDDSCNVCHFADDDMSAITGCDDCHAGHDMTVHEVTTDTGDCLRCHGNDGAPANDVRGIHADCDTCHDNATYPGITTGKTSDCVGCHNAGLVDQPYTGGDFDPYDPAHYTGTETTHTADNAGDTGFSNTDGYTCVTCHKQEMKPEHFKASSSFPDVPGTYADKCVDCHESEVDSISGAWNDDCVECHATGGTHTLFDTQHNAIAAWDTACGGGGCHDTDNVDLIHKNSVASNPTVTTCVNTCHTGNDAVPTSINCDTGGCHSGAGHSHELDVAGSVGCYDTGAGCHVSSDTDYASTDYHPANGCTSGNCHAASNRNDAAYDNPNACSTCHDGSYDGAPDTDPVDTAAPAGHYGETTHTAAAADRTSTVRGAAGGVVTATCANCHNGTGTGIDGLYRQHQGLDDKGNIGCEACHNAFSAQVAANWTNDRCIDCHNLTDMPDAGDTAYAHGANAPVVNGTGSGCVTGGCHSTWNLHALHKGDGVGSDPACSVCHDYSGQGARPTQTSCGVGNDCHNTSPTHPGEDDAHNVTIAGDTGGCVRCHELNDIRTQHADNCATCHNTGTNLGSGNTADCIDCHDGETANGDVYYNAADNPDYRDHYDYYNAIHQENDDISTKSWGTTDYGVTLDRFFTGGNPADTTGHSYNVPCANCHTNDMMTEHSKTTVGFSTVPGTHSDVCVACHELKVDSFASAWTGGCGGQGAVTCHPMTSGAGGLHRTSGSGWDEKHNASAWPLTTPGSVSTSVIGGGGPTPGGGSLGPGFSDGFESNNFSAWTSAQAPSAGGWSTLWTDGFESNNFSAWTSSTNRWAVQTATKSTGTYGAWVDGSTSESLLTKTGLSFAGTTGARVVFDWRQNQAEASDNFELQTTTNGSTWTTVADYMVTDFTPTTFQTVTQTIGTNVVGIRFRVITNVQGGNDQIFLDNVRVQGNMPATTGGWNVQTTQKYAGTYGARAIGGTPMDADGFKLTKTGIDNTNATSVNVSYAIRWDNLESADDVIVQYTTNSGGAWSDIKNYAPAGADPASQAWKVETFTGLPAGINGIRFRFHADNPTGDLLYVDAVTVTPQSAGSGPTATSCQNNPNGTECHNVADVADIHSDISGRTDNGCPICHTGTAQHPTIKNCQAAGCHAGVNIDEHDNHHDTNFVAASFDTNFNRSWCQACHIGAGGTGGVDGIDDEHEVLDAYHNNPCSMCHKKATDTAGAAPVTRANTINTITTRGGGTAICDDCHKTFTKARPHVQRATIGGVQFDTGTVTTNAWSGHRVYTVNPGMLDVFSGTTSRWTNWANRPNSFITAGTELTLQTGSLTTCNMCHQATYPTADPAPHAGTMQVKLDTDYPTPYWNGALSGSANLTKDLTGDGIDGTPLCVKCHNLSNGNRNNANKVHKEHDDRGNDGEYCIQCHAKTPHQTPYFRMLAPRGTSKLGSDNGTGLNGVREHAITNPADDWSTGDCGAQCDTSRHPYSSFWQQP